MSLEGTQLKLIRVAETGSAANPLGGVGFTRSALCVVAVAGSECLDAFPAASIASIVYEYDLEASSAESRKVVTLPGSAINVPPR